MISYLRLTLKGSIFQAEEKLGGKKGRLLGIITLSDVLRYMVGAANIGGDGDVSEEDDS